MSTNLSIDSAALQASELSGLPIAFVKSLIQEEGTLPDTNNPFDITQVWVNATGFESYIIGIWNSIGVVIFSDPNIAIQSWAKGILTFSNYSQLRNDMSNPNISAYQLAKDLQDAGYAGSDNQYAQKIAALYQENSGKSAYAPLGETVAPPAQTTTNPGVSPTSPGMPTTTPTLNLSFGEGILHLLISGFLVIIALVMIVVGIYLLMPAKTKQSAGSLIEAMS